MARAPETLWIRREHGEIITGLIGWNRVPDEPLPRDVSPGQFGRDMVRITGCNLLIGGGRNG